MTHALTVSRVRENMATKVRGQSDKQWLDKWIATETKSLVGSCEGRPWPDVLRRCIVAARDPAAVHACEKEDFARSPVRTCCERVAEHQVRLLSKELAAGSSSADDMFASIQDTHEEQLRRACANVWTATERKCVLAAQTTTAARACADANAR